MDKNKFIVEFYLNRAEIKNHKEVSRFQNELDILSKKIRSRDYKNSADLKSLNSERKKLDNEIKALKLKIINTMHDKNLQLIEPEIIKLGGTIYAQTINNVFVKIDPSEVEKLKNLPNVASVKPSIDYKINYNMNNQVVSTGAVDFWNLSKENLGKELQEEGFIGEGFNFAMMDQELSVDLPALSHHRIIVHPDMPTENSSHGTLVAGGCCIDAVEETTEIRYQGIAYGRKTIIASSPDDNNDEVVTQERIAWLVFQSEKPDVINISWGGGGTNNVIIDDEVTAIASLLDSITEMLDILVVKAAGNNKNISDGNLDDTCTLDYPSEIYNGLTVANMRDNNEIDRTKHHIEPKSSQGPIPISLRKKPDITAPGEDSHLPYWWNGTTMWTEGFGTSLASPKVAGGVLLLRSAGIDSAKVIKAILINSSDAWDVNAGGMPGQQIQGSYWCPVYGWGYMNLSNAYREMFNTVESILTTSNNRHTYNINMEQYDKVTLVWNKNGQQDLSNIKLELYNEDGELENQDTSIVDNVKQVDAKTTGLKTIVIYCDNIIETEEYALASKTLIITL